MTVVTMAMKVLHKSCNMCIHDLPDINVLIPWDCSESQAYVSGKSHMSILKPLHMGTVICLTSMPLTFIPAALRHTSKSLVYMLQLLCNTSIIVVTTPVG